MRAWRPPCPAHSLAVVVSSSSAVSRAACLWLRALAQSCQVEQPGSIREAEFARELLAVAKEYQRRRAAHAEARSHRRRVVDVDLSHAQLAAEVFRELFDERLQRLARRAPDRAEIEQKRLLG